MVDRDAESLTALLRCELTAVNQQFSHVLALNAWGEKEIAERIMAVDYVDFPNAMRILDTLIETGAPLALPKDSYCPGRSVTGILAAEQAMEQRLAATLAAAQVTTPRAQALVATAREPRAAYARWLDDRLSQCNPDDTDLARPDARTAGLTAQLIALIEQAMAHAFVHWHAGDAAGADAAWAASGGAMMQLTALTRFHTARQDVPAPDTIPALRVSRQLDEAVAADGRLAGRVAERAAKTAQETEEAALAKLCRRIAEDCEEQARWVPGQPHPASQSNPPAFASFQATLERFDIAQPRAT